MKKKILLEKGLEKEPVKHGFKRLYELSIISGVDTLEMIETSRGVRTTRDELYLWQEEGWVVQSPPSESEFEYDYVKHSRIQDELEAELFEPLRLRKSLVIKDLGGGKYLLRDSYDNLWEVEMD